MSDEEFVRCTNCGNLNIKGNKHCIFCDTDLSDAPISTEDASPEALAAAPSVKVDETPTEPSTPEEETIPIPKVPSVDELETKEDAKAKEKKEEEEKIIAEKVDRTQFSTAKKFLFVTIFSLLVAIVHYALNLLISYIAIDFNDPNIQIPPIPSNLNSLVEINSLSVILGVIFAIIVGYFIGKIVRTYSANKSELIRWTVYAIFFDVVVNFGLAIILMVITDAIGLLRDILYVYLAGSAIIFAVVSLVSLFIPMLSGTFIFYNQIDKILFPRKYRV